MPTKSSPRTASRRSTPAKAAQPPRTSPTARPTSFSRVLLKVSGEAFCKPGAFGLDPEELRVIAEQIKDASAHAQLAIVVGGGNFIRGAKLSGNARIPRATADYMGMLGTILNALALREALAAAGVDSRVMSALEIRAVAESFIRGRALRHMDKGRVVILAAGTGNPFFSTDTCAALRAAELDCQVLLKATKVDGVYTADPQKDRSATKFTQLTFSEALSRKLAVMDLTALAMCQENNLPVVVFDFKRPGNIRRVVTGEPVGTFVYPG